MRRVVLALTLSILTFGNAIAAFEEVAPEFRGTWVPAKAACNSPLKIVIETRSVTFINGAERSDFKKLDQCFSCAGRDVSNVVWLTTDAMGDSPFTLFLNNQKKNAPAITGVDYLDKKLGQRFPLKGPLKRCP